MKTKELRSMAILMGLGVALFAAGCGAKVPCNTDPSQVEAARAELRAAEQKAESGEAQLAESQQALSKLEADLKGLDDTSDLEARLHSLKKGSGR